MDNAVMVDFRLSKGDGIEFKKRFVKVKNSLSDIIGKELTSWWLLFGLNKTFRILFFTFESFVVDMSQLLFY